MRGVKYPRMYAARDEKFRAGGYVTEPGLHFLSHKREAFTHWLSLPERGNTHPVQTSSQPTPATIDFSGHLNVRSYKRNKNKIVNASASQVYAPFLSCIQRVYYAVIVAVQPPTNLLLLKAATRQSPRDFPRSLTPRGVMTRPFNREATGTWTGLLSGDSGKNEPGGSRHLKNILYLPPKHTTTGNTCCCRVLVLQ